MSSTPSLAANNDLKQLPSHVKETYEEVLKLVPGLKEYEETNVQNLKEKYEIRLYKRDKVQDLKAMIEIDKNTGDILSFEHTSQLEESTNPPSDELAKEKATAFLSELFDEKFAAYKVDRIEEDEITISIETAEENDLEVNRDIKRVLFASQDEKGVNLAVRVDSEGIIYSVQPVLQESNLNSNVQQGVKRLYAAVPELKEESYTINRKDTKSGDELELPQHYIDRDQTTFSGDITNFTFDNLTGELNHLYLDQEQGKSENPVSQEVAKVKAAQFTQQVIEDSAKYKFVALGTVVNDAGTAVGFITPLSEHKGYVKHLTVFVDQAGKVFAVNSNVHEDSMDFEEYYQDFSKNKRK